MVLTHEKLFGDIFKIGSLVKVTVRLNSQDKTIILYNKNKDTVESFDSGIILLYLGKEKTGHQISKYGSGDTMRYDFYYNNTLYSSWDPNRVRQTRLYNWELVEC